MGSIPRIPTPARKFIHSKYTDNEALTKVDRRRYAQEHQRIFGRRTRRQGYTRKVYPAR